LALFSLFFIAVCNNALNVGFATYTHPCGEVSLKYFPYIREGENEYEVLQGLCLAGVLIWCAGGAALVIALLFKIPRNATDLSFRRATCAISMSFRKEYPHWFIIILLRSFFLTLAVTIFEDGASQTAFLTVVFTLYGCLLLIYQPYFAPILKYCDICYSFLNIVLLTLIQLYSLTLKGEAAVTLVTVVLYGIVGTLTLYSCYLYAKQQLTLVDSNLAVHGANIHDDIVKALSPVLPASLEYDFFEAVLFANGGGQPKDNSKEAADTANKEVADTSI
jgi:hypothetical protein